MQTISFEIDDDIYHKFIRKIGTDNLALYFQNFMNEFANNDELFPIAYTKLGEIKPLKISIDSIKETNL